LPAEPDWRKETKMDWDLLLELGFGEEPSGEGLYHAYDVPLDRKEKCISSLKSLQQGLRRELQYREYRRNSPAVPEDGLDPNPAERDVYFDLFEDNHPLDPTTDSVRHENAKKIPPPPPAEGDLQPVNKEAGMSSEISQLWCWGSINGPLISEKDLAPSGEAQKLAEDDASESQMGPDSEEPNRNQDPSSSESGQALLYDPSAPLIDYAIDGYDGENMDGIE